MTRIAIALSLAAASWVGPAVLAQGARGTIAGIVTDNEGPVHTADIEARNKATSTIYRARTDVRGRYTVSVPPGTYEVAVLALGFRTDRKAEDDKVVEAGKTLSLDFVLPRSNDAVVGDDAAFVAIRKKYIDLKGPLPRAANGKPDLSGVWNANVDGNPAPPPLLPWAEQEWKRRQATDFKELPSSFCLPDDPSWSTPIPQKIVQTPTLIVMLNEGVPGFRQIFLDGRPHPKDPDPTWQGHSIGRWEGDTLVVDTIGFNDKSWLLPEGFPHTDQMRIIERYRRLDLANLTREVTIIDPGAFTKPLERRIAWHLAPGEELLESICNENNKFLENISNQ